MLRLLSTVGLVFALAGVALFVALAIGTWSIKREADQQVAAATDKAYQAGDVAAKVIALIREVIARARASLAAARAASTTPEAVEDPLARLAMWKARRELPGEIEKARDVVGVASEAVVVAGAALDVFGEHRSDEA